MNFKKEIKFSFMKINKDNFGKMNIGEPYYNLKSN